LAQEFQATMAAEVGAASCHQGPAFANNLKVENAVIWTVKGQNGSLQWADNCSLAQVQLYWLRKRLRPAFSLLMICYLSLALFEQPSWCLGDNKPCANQLDGVFSSGIPTFETALTNAVEMVLLVLLALRLLLRRLALGSAFLMSWWTLSLAILLATSLLDCVVGVFRLQGISLSHTSFRWSRLCRPLIFLASYTDLRQTLERVVSALLRVLNILVSLALCVLLFVWLGLVLFAGTAEGRERFSGWQSALSSMWILYTTANSPDVWIPAYNANRASFFFFAAYMLVVLYLLNNVLLAAVYSAYRERLKRKMEETFSYRQLALERAFELLKDDNGLIGSTKWAAFLSRYCYAARVTSVRQPMYSKAMQMFDSLDVDGNGGLDLTEFSLVLDAIETLSQRLAAHEPRHRFQSREQLPYPVRLVLRGVRVYDFKISWDSIVDLFIAADLSCWLFHTISFVSADPDGPYSPHSHVFWSRSSPWNWMGFAFSCIYVCDASMRLWIFGWENIWQKRPRHYQLDMLLVYTLFGLNMFFLFEEERPTWVTRAAGIMHILRALRLMRHIPPLRQLVTLMVELAPTYRRLGFLLFIVFYMYATVGMQIFGGMVRESAKELDGTDYAKGEYWNLNFNDFFSAFVTLFVLMVLNNWYIVAGAFYQLSGTVWSQVYFVSFFVIVNLIVLNILVAFILECCETMHQEAECLSNGQIEQTPLHSNSVQPDPSGHTRQFHREEVLRRVLFPDHSPLASPRTPHVVPEVIDGPEGGNGVLSWNLSSS